MKKTLWVEKICIIWWWENEENY